jgi:hypothetical protein
MSDKFSLNIVVPEKWLGNAADALRSHDFKTVEEYFQILTGLLMEKITPGMHYQLIYNQISSRNGGYIFKMDIEGTTDAIGKYLSDENIHKMLVMISPYSANKTMTFGPENIFSITIGHGDGFESRLPVFDGSSTSSSTTTSSESSQSKNFKDSYPSYMLLKLVVPPANLADATRVANDCGFSTIENYFDALKHMIKFGCNNIYQNRLSAKNGAHIFTLEINAMYDDFYYIFDRHTANMIRRMSPYLVDDMFCVWTPVVSENVLQYEHNAAYHIIVGKQVGFKYYMGEPCEEIENMALESAMEEMD